MKNYPEALRKYAKASEISPGRAFYYSCMGDMMKRMDRQQEAEELYRKAEGLKNEADDYVASPSKMYRH